jgi:prophage antirepressor-like protein
MELTNCDFNINNIRVIQSDGEPWFVVVDVCKTLGLHHVTNALQNCKNSTVQNYRIPGTCGRPNKLISESGLNVSAALRNVNTNDVTLNRIQRMGNKRRRVKLVSESGAASGSKQPQKLHRAAVRLTESVCGAGTTCTP